MSKSFNYSSELGAHIADFVAQKHSSGLIYDYEAGVLKAFDDFYTNNGYYTGTITKEIMDNWYMRFLHVSNGTRAQMILFVRLFSLYLNSIGIDSYVPGKTPTPNIPVPHIFSREELQSFFVVVDTYTPRAAWIPSHRLADEYRIVFRSIYCYGLRISEACNLRCEHVDLENGVITVMHSKGDKDRLVYLADDLKKLMSMYWERVYCQLEKTSEWFLPSANPQKHILKTSLDRKFNEFWSKTPYAGTCDKKPTVHCLRHTFVVEKMNSWMSSEIDMNVMMPYLSKYLGHKGRNETFYYYHQVKEAFRIVKEKDTVSVRVIPEATAYEI